VDPKVRQQKYGQSLEQIFCKEFPPVSAHFRQPIRRKPAAGGYTEAPDIVDESRTPDCGEGFPVFPVFPPDLFGWSAPQK
jgi:hypothetical protein